MPSYRETEIARAFHADNTERLAELIAEIDRDRASEIAGYRRQADYRRDAIAEAYAVLEADVALTESAVCGARNAASGWRHTNTCGKTAKVLRTWTARGWDPKATPTVQTIALCGQHRKTKGQYGMGFQDADEINVAAQQLRDEGGI